MRQYLHLPYDTNVSHEELAQMMAEAFPASQVVTRGDEVSIRYRAMVRGRLRVRRDEKEQMVTVSYGSSMPAGLAWWPWLLGVLPAVTIWVIYMCQKGNFISQMTSTLQTRLCSGIPKDSLFYASEKERENWRKGAAQSLRWLGILWFASLAFNQLAVFLRIYINYHYNLATLASFNEFVIGMNRVADGSFGLLFGVCLITLGKGSKSGVWAGILKLVLLVCQSVASLIVMKIMRKMDVGEIEYFATNGNTTWWSITFPIIETAFALTIGYLLWRSLRTGPGRYLFLASIWSVGIGLTAHFLEPLVAAQTHTVLPYVLYIVVMFFVNFIPAIMTLKAWYLMPNYMRIPKPLSLHRGSQPRVKSK